MTASTRPSPPSGTAALHLRQRRVLAILPMLALRAVRGSGWLRALHCLRRTAAVRTLCGRRTDGCLWRGLLLPSGWPSHPPQSTGNHLEAPGSLSTPLAGTQLSRLGLKDPGGISRPDHPAVRCGLPRTKRRRLPQRSLSRLNHAAYALPVYTLRRRSPAAAQHSVPAGGQPWPDGTHTRRAAIEISGSTSFPPFQAWPGVLGA